MAQPIIPPDLRKKPRRPVNLNVERQLSSKLNGNIGSELVGPMGRSRPGTAGRHPIRIADIRVNRYAMGLRLPGLDHPIMLLAAAFPVVLF